MTEENYRALFDRASPGRDLVEDTLAAAERPRRKGVPTKRLAAALVCLALVLGVGNYQVLAAGVQRIIRFFAGAGASETSVMVVEQADQWTEGDWLCQLDGVSQGEYLLLELYLVSPELEEHQLATRILQVYADGVPLEQGDQVYSEWLPYNGFIPQGQAWMSLSGLDCGPEVAWREEGYRARVHMPFTYRLPEETPTELTYELLDLEGGGSHTGTLTLTPAETQAAWSDSRTFAEGTVTALVSEDGRQLSVYAHREENDEGQMLTGASLFHHQVTFIGASGERYPDAGEGFRSFTSGHVNVQLAAAPSWVEEPIVAVEIDAIQLVYEYDTWWDGPGGGMVRTQGDATYGDLNWIIDLT
ncbi:hypothetical protein [uncultured Flavonifractor sp.]|uniref:hypothetical protein n=1 Tax=uncultured Flavonifractor sp. TaxID=1193534 RepID=UPI00260AE2FA|nr:hypothetical protein [uncultured Flavonifractor sp.]